MYNGINKSGLKLVFYFYTFFLLVFYRKTRRIIGLNSVVCVIPYI